MIKFQKSLACMAAALLLAAGCKSSPPKAKAPANGPMFTFVVKVGGGLEKAEFPVDMFLVGSQIRRQVENVNIDDYFKANNPVRKLAETPRTYQTVSIPHSGTNAMRFVLDKKTRFPNYTDLVIIAKIPVEVPDGTNSPDPRRRFLPLASEKWSPKTREVTVTITSGGIRSDPEPIENP